MDGSLVLRDRKNAANGITPIYLQSLVDKGIQCFRNGDSATALRYLKQAIDDDHDPPLLVLDKRAAVFVKVGDFAAATADVRRIIKRSPTNAVGYLRLGQILQLQRQHDASLRAYAKGLRVVSPQDPHLQVELVMGVKILPLTSCKTLRSSRDKMISMLAPKTARDPLKDLPGELALMIQKYLGFRDIVNASGVCRLWRQSVNSQPSLWTDLDFSTGRRSVSLETVRAYMRRSEGAVQRYATCPMNKDPKTLLYYIADRCKRLTELSYQHSFAGEVLLKSVRAMPHLSQLVLSPHCEIPSEICFDILQECELLQDAEFHNVQGSPSHGFATLRHLGSLRKLVLNGDKLAQHVMDERIVQCFTNARHLEMQNWNYWRMNPPDTGFLTFENLEYLDLCGSRISFAAFPSSLRELHLRNVNSFDAGGLDIGQHFPRLTHLALARPQLRPSSVTVMFKWLRANKGNLVELDLSHLLLSAVDIQKLVDDGYLDSVRILRLKECEMTDAMAALVAMRCKRLRLLDITSTPVTGVGVKDLVRALRPSLIWLGLDSCFDVSPDAAEWARCQGIKVSFNFRERIGKGKKVVAP